MTNAIAAGSSGTLLLGVSGTITNQSTGTMRFVITAASTIGNNTLTNSSGGIVNFGTIAATATAATHTNLLQVGVANQAFTNQAGGQVITESGNVGLFLIRADKIANLGTNIVNAGTLTYETRTGGAGILENAGLVQFGGGTLVVDKFTNATATSEIRLSGGSGTISGSAVFNAGVITLASGATLTFTGSTFTNDATGYIRSNGGILDLRGSFFNSSVASNTASEFKFDSGTLLFQGGAASTFSLAGLDLGNSFSGTNNNFFIANLTVAGGTTVTLQSAAGTALYISNLVGTAGNTLNLAAGQKVYFVGETNTFAGTINLNGGEIIKLGFVAPTVFSFIGNTGEFDWNTAGNWDNGVPSSDGTALITNSITGNTVIFNGAGSTSIASFTLSNSTVFTHTTIFSNNTTTVAGTTVLGRNNIIQIGAGADQGTFSTGGLLMDSNAQIVFTNSSGAAVNTLIVAGTFTNTTQSVIKLDGVGGSALLRFQSTGITTNQGRMILAPSAAGATVTVQAGSDATAGTLFNSGSIDAVIKGSTDSHTFTFSNRLVNAGTVVLSNVTSTAGASIQFNVSQQTTNQAGGTLKMFVDGSASGKSNVYLSGLSIQNLGNIIMEAQDATSANQLRTTGTGGFSNKVGGVITVGAGNLGLAEIRAVGGSNIVNEGIINIANGTLAFRSGAGANIASLDNSGTVNLTGGTLDVLFLTNRGSASRLMVTANSTLTGNTLVNQGVVSNSATLTFTGGRVHNTGTVNLTGGHLAFGTYSNATAGSRLIVAGTGGTLVGGLFVNAGVITNTANLTFTGGIVQNSGTIAMNAGNTFTFDKLTNTSNTARMELLSGNATLTGSTFVNFGVISMASGGTFTFNGLSLTNATTIGTASGILSGTGVLAFQGASFYNESTNNTAFKFGGGSLLFTNSASVSDYTLTLAGVDLLNRFSKTNNNFYVGNLVLDGGALTLAAATGTNAALTKALYVGNLTLAAGTTLDLGGMNIYFAGSTNGLDGVTLLNGTTANIIQMVNFTNVLAISSGVKAYGTDANWSENEVPTSTDNARIEGTIAGSGSITFAQDRSANSLVVSNNGDGTLRVAVQARTYSVNSTMLIGSNSFVELGATAAGGTLSAGSLILTNGGGIQFAANQGTAGGNDTLIVNGTFKNTSDSFITNTSSGFATMQFNGSDPVTNSGLIRLIINATGSGSLAFQMAVANTNFFVNNGTFVLGTAGASTSTKVFTMTNQLVNTGYLVLTNATGGGSGGQVQLRVAGVSGSASTNASTGTIRLVQTDAAAAASANAGTITFVNGGFVNSGTITWHQNKSSATTWALSDGSVFSNSATGRIIAEAGTTGSLEFRTAGAFVNLGTMQANAGTLSISTLSPSTAQFLHNAGTIELIGGTVDSSTDITNAAGGVIRTTANTGTLVGNLVNLAGGVVSNVNGTLVISRVQANSGTITIGTGGLTRLGIGNAAFSNTGTVNLWGGGSAVASNLVNMAGGEIRGGGVISNLGAQVFNAAGATIAADDGAIALRFTNSLTMRNEGFLRATNSGTLIFGTASGSAQISNAGTIFLAGGTLRSGTITNLASGNVVLAGGGTFTAGTLVNFGTLTATNVAPASARAWENVATTIDMRGGTIVSGNMTNTATVLGFGTVAGNLINNGIVNVTNGTLNLTVGLSNAVGGVIDIGGGPVTNRGTLNVTPVWANAGTVLMNSNATLVGSQLNNSGLLAGAASGATGTASVFSVVRNLSGGVVSNAGAMGIINAEGSTVSNLVGGTYVMNGIRLRFSTDGSSGGSSNAFLNAGTFVHNSGTTEVGAFVNTGRLVVGGGAGTMLVNAEGTIFSNTTSGRVFLDSGTLVFNSSLAGASASNMVNLGVIEGRGVGGTFGALNAQVHFTNAVSGLILNTNSTATIAIQGGGSRFVNEGRMIVSNNATINMINTAGTGNEWLNENIVRLGDDSSAGFLNSGTINNSGTISGSGTISMKVGTAAGRDFVNFADASLVSSNGTLAITNLTRIVNRGTISVLDGSTMYLMSVDSTVSQAFITNSAIGTISMRGGTLGFAGTAGGVTNVGTLIGFGTVTNAVIRNTGTIFANNASSLNLAGPFLINQVSGIVTARNSSLVVGGVFTNLGTFTMFNSVGTFNSAVVNSGAWITDPTTNVFNNTFTVTSSGSISADAGDVYIFKQHFVNESTQSNTWETLNAGLNTSTNVVANIGTKFVFEGDGSSTQNFFHAGLTLTGGFIGVPDPLVTGVQTVSTFGAVSGFKTNFALGTLELQDTTLQLVDAFGTVGPDDGKLGGLFVKNLFLDATSSLIISNNMRLYFINSNDWSLANVTLLGNAEIHQLVSLAVIPEPSVVLLWLSSIGTIYASRRRQQKNGKRGK